MTHRRTYPAKSPALTGGEDDNWRTRGLCAQSSADSWFPAKPGRYLTTEAERAKDLCRVCPVAAECFADALRNTPEYGIFAGLEARDIRAAKERKAARRAGA